MLFFAVMYAAETSFGGNLEQNVLRLNNFCRGSLHGLVSHEGHLTPFVAPSLLTCWVPPIA